ncbi:MAG: DNA methyltransferase, partial [Elusimicrobiota bacterium]
DTSFSGLDAFGLREKDKEFIKKIYTIANYEKRFQIFLIELKHLSPEIIRNLPLYFEREIQYPLFVITQDYKDYTFILVEKIRESAGVWKRKLVKLNFDRENAYYTDKLVLSNMAVQKDKSEPAMTYRILQEALSVEKVSKLFFDDYKTIFFEIRKFLLKQYVNIKQSHEFSQQLLNRIMFIYFIDKKRWLKSSPKFMKWFWSRYLEEKKGKDEFYEKWLKVLFLEAFNNRFSHPQYLPQDVRDALGLAPYLNGGLFKRNELDELSINIPDDFIDKILKFFEKYNFTIREDLPLDVEVAVDPQMIGYVYESLANVAEEIYERQDLGIFYTPKVEVDFMCRRSLVEYLIKKLEAVPKNLIYNFVFNENHKEKEKYFDKNNLWEKIEETLDELAVLDPTCGSGAFLVGMLKVLTELYRTVFSHLNRQMTDYELKKRIIGHSLYGVDVMPWAVHSAELRLWLSLMIESDLTLGDLKLYPLLPNLNLKLRVGDSLVQEIGGINLNLRDIYLSPSLKRKLTELKNEKEKYYNNDPTAKFKTEDAILQEELRIFHQIIDDRIITLQKKKQTLTVGKQAVQSDMFEKEFPKQKDLLDEEEFKKIIEKQKTEIDEEIEKLTEIKQKLKEQKPFI